MKYVSSILSSFKSHLPSSLDSVSSTGSPLVSIYEAARKIKEYFNSSLTKVDAFVGPLQDHLEDISPDDLFEKGSIPIDFSLSDTTSINFGPCVLPIEMGLDKYDELFTDLLESVKAANSTVTPVDGEDDNVDEVSVTITDRSGNAYCITFGSRIIIKDNTEYVINAWCQAPTIWDDGSHPFSLGIKPLLYKIVTDDGIGNIVSCFFDPLLYSINLTISEVTNDDDYSYVKVESGSITAIQALLVELSASASLSSFLGSVSDTLLSAKDSAATASVIFAEAAKYKFDEIKQAANGIVQSISRSGFVGGIQYILQYFKQLLNTVKDHDSDQPLAFTDNESLTPQIFIVGVLGTIVSTMIDVAAAIFAAVRPIAGLAISAVSNVISSFITAINPENLTRGSISIVQAFTQPCYPMALFQRTLLLADNDDLIYLKECIDQSPSGAIMIDIPFGRFICGKGSTDPIYDTDTIIFEFHPFLTDFRNSCSTFNDALGNILSRQSRLRLPENYSVTTEQFFRPLGKINCTVDLRDDSGELWTLLYDTVLSGENAFTDPCFINDRDGALNVQQDRVAREICAVNSYLADMYIILSYQKWYRDHYGLNLPLSQLYEIQLGYTASRTISQGIDVTLWIPGGQEDYPDFSPLSFILYRPSITQSDVAFAKNIGQDQFTLDGDTEYCRFITKGTGSYVGDENFSAQKFLCTWVDLVAHMAKYSNNSYHDIFLGQTTAYEFYYLISGGFNVAVNQYDFADWCFTLPKIEASSFWAIIIGSAAIIAVTTAAVVVSSILTKKRRQRKNAERNLAITKAKQEWERNPTDQNYKYMRKLINTANIRASFFGGTRYTDSGAVAFPTTAPVSSSSQADDLASSQTAGKIDQMIVADIDAQASGLNAEGYQNPSPEPTISDIIKYIIGERN